MKLKNYEYPMEVAGGTYMTAEDHAAGVLTTKDTESGQSVQTVVFPTLPIDGWRYDNDGEASAGIETSEDEDGEPLKRVRLNKKGFGYAVAQEVTPAELKKAKVLAGKDQSNFEPAMASLSVKVYKADGQLHPYVWEQLAIQFKARDYGRIIAISNLLNF